ncbi:MAG: hypothetical protein UX63_C0032G0001, partial [Microgenomates group bacterium GW2011_GWB1_46_7]
SDLHLLLPLAPRSLLALAPRSLLALAPRSLLARSPLLPYHPLLQHLFIVVKKIPNGHIIQFQENLIVIGELPDVELWLPP